jgi:hypothetical protein
MMNRVKLCFQVAWLTSAFVALVMSFNLCAATDQACTDAGGRMFLVMVLLSFPAGIFCVVAALFILEVILEVSSSDQLNEYLLFWWIMAGAGYLQWFVLAPRLFGKPEFTSLGLDKVNKAEKTATQIPSPTITALSPPDTSAEIRPSQLPKPKRVRRVRAYDHRGRTPLERALSSNSTGAFS